MTLHGIDISGHQSTTPSLAGRDFAIVRATYGTSRDGRYTQHAANVRAAGRVLGAYHFGRSVQTPTSQAAAFLAAAKGADLLALDVEKDSHPAPVPDDPAMTQVQARAFIAAVHAAGRPIGLYHSESGFFDAGQDWDWVANWANAPHHPYSIWQYRGSPLDLDLFEGTRAELLDLGRVPPAPPSDTGGNVEIAGKNRAITAKGGHGIFTTPAKDAANLIRNTVQGETLRLVGNQDLFQCVWLGDRAGFISNLDIASFLTLPPPAATDCTAAVKAATDPLNAKITGLETELANASGTERERIADAEHDRIAAL